MKKRSFRNPCFWICILTMASLACAGDLNPPAPPTSGTMKPLDQVEPRTALIPGPVPIGADYLIWIDQPGSYYLITDVTVNFRHAIKITASHVTLDLNGFRLYSSWTPPTLQNQNFDGIYIAGGCENINICNGSIVSDIAGGKKGFRYGVYAVETSSRIRLSNIKVVGSRLWGFWLGGTGSEADRCTVWKNGSGISVGLKGMIQFCEVSENTTDALQAIRGIQTGDSSFVFGNRVFQNGTDAASSTFGILAGWSSVVKENVVSENGERCGQFAHGIYAGWGSVVADCTVADNGYCARDSIGIATDRGVSVIGCAVYGNGWSVQSTSAGIYAAEGCILKNNTVYKNGWAAPVSCGIYAPFYCLLDGNAAYEQSVNIFTSYGCVLGLNLAP